MKELTQKKMLAILCAPEPVDEPEESDFEEYDELEEEKFVTDWIERELV